MIQLNSERCVMKRLSANDIERASTIFTNQIVRTYLGGALCKEDAILHLESWLKDANSEYYCVYLKDCAEFVGIVYLTPYHDDERMELSFEFLPQYWGNGYAREAVSTMLRYCFDVKKQNEIVAETQTKNVSSRKLLEKLDYHLEKEFIRYGEKQSVYVKRSM